VGPRNSQLPVADGDLLAAAERRVCELTYLVTDGTIEVKWGGR
jgi:hypothetical protein